MNASWRFAGCANAIKGDLVRRDAFSPAHICENDRFSQSTLVSPTRLADRASMRGSITLDAVRVFKTARRYGGEALPPSGKSVYDTDLTGRVMHIASCNDSGEVVGSRAREDHSEKSGVAVEAVCTKRKAELRKTLCENPSASAKGLRFDIRVFLFYRSTGNAGACIRSGLSEKANVSGAGSTRLPSLERS